MSQISHLQPLKSAAGWYAGTLYYDEEMGGWFPNSRDSGYFYSKWEVQRYIGMDLDLVRASEAVDEIQAEIKLCMEQTPKATGLRKELLLKRFEFLKNAKASFVDVEWPTEEWDYSIMC